MNSEVKLYTSVRYMAMKLRSTTDQDQFLSMMRGWGVPLKEYEEKQYLIDEARDAGAVRCFDAHEYVSFYFNAKGRYLGVCTWGLGSWRPRKRRRK